MILITSSTVFFSMKGRTKRHQHNYTLKKSTSPWHSAWKSILYPTWNCCFHSFPHLRYWYSFHRHGCGLSPDHTLWMYRKNFWLADHCFCNRWISQLSNSWNFDPPCLTDVSIQLTLRVLGWLIFKPGEGHWGEPGMW